MIWHPRDVSNNAVKIPLLGDLPVLGYLFRSNERTDNKTELLISLRPASSTISWVCADHWPEWIFQYVNFFSAAVRSRTRLIGSFLIALCTGQLWWRRRWR